MKKGTKDSGGENPQKGTVHRFGYEAEQEPAVISKYVLDLFLQQDKPGDCMALYLFYYYTAKWQKTDTPKATNRYVANGLRWSLPRVIKAGKILRALRLIEKVSVWGQEEKRIIGHYVKVRFLWGPMEERGLFPKQNPRVSISYTVGKVSSNALSPNNKKEKGNPGHPEKQSKTPRQTLPPGMSPISYDPNILPAPWNENPELKAAWSDFVEYRRSTRRKPISPAAYKLSMRKMEGFTPAEIIAALQEAIAGDYQSFFPKKGRGSSIPSAIPKDDKRDNRDLKLINSLLTARDRLTDEDKRDIARELAGVSSFYEAIPHKAGEDLPNCSCSRFLRDWVSYVLEYRDSQKPLNPWLFSTSSFFWKGFLKQEQSLLGVDFRTGRRI